MGTKRLVSTRKTVINRTDYGLNWNQSLRKLAGVMVGEDVSIVIDVEAGKK